MSTTITLDEFPGVFTDIGEQISQLNFEPVMIAALEAIAEGERTAFDAETSPGGVQWAPNAQSTIKRKGLSVPLFETGALEASLVAVGGPGNIHEASDHGLVFGTEVPYSIYNQEGTQTIPAREHVGISEDLVDAITKEVADFAIEQLRGNSDAR